MPGLYESEQDEEEKEGYAGGGDAVREQPGDAEVEAGLDDHEVGVYAEDCGGGGDHDDEPEVQLRFGPGVAAFSGEDADYGCVGHGGEGVGVVRGGEVSGWWSA